MKLAVIGTGYVGLVTGTCFAESGNEVTCVDVDEAKIAALQRGEIPIYEPGLAELVERNRLAKRLLFTTETAEAVADAEIVYLAVGTPQADDGSANLQYLFAAIEAVAPHLAPTAIVVTKSTVPVGTNAAIDSRLCELTGRACDVASNPEFLKEGAAVQDFMFPDRVVVGVRRDEVGELLRRLYSPFLRTDKPFLIMSPESAELTKYVANSLLATKISFINEMANVCGAMGADINDVRRGIGHDQRIGFAFLFPGVGYGGSCFPKDVRAMMRMAEAHDVEPQILAAVDAVNQRQKLALLGKITKHFGQQLAGARLALWGLAFKPRTDDIREAPALALIERLLDHGVRVVVHDPVAMDNVRQQLGDRISYAKGPQEALADAQALVIMTEWGEFRHPDFADMRAAMDEPVIFDGRNLYDPEEVSAAGFTYYSIGRPPARPGSPLGDLGRDEICGLQRF
jgi:UDPglucose 6-dehydrogenase